MGNSYPLRAAAAIIIAAIIIVGFAGSASADHGQPPDRPIVRISMDWGDRLAFRHQGPFCWWYSVGPHGRPRAILIDGERAERGAPCRGRRIAMLRLPWDSHEDEVHVWNYSGRILVWVPEVEAP